MTSRIGPSWMVRRVVVGLGFLGLGVEVSESCLR